MKIQFLKFIILIIFLNEISTAQEDPVSDELKKNKTKVTDNSYKISDLKTSRSLNETENFTNNTSNRIISDYNQRFVEERMIKFREENKTVQYSFDLVSSLGRNINFGGLWNDIAVMNISPKMYIQPVDFLNVFASYNLSNFIPLTNIKDIKDHIKSFAIQSISILAIDNFTGYLFNSKNWMTSLIEFTLKNLAINLFIKPSVNKMNNQTLPRTEDEYYYYSLNLKF